MQETYMLFIWLGLAVILGAFEAATVSLVSIWFVIGAVAAMIPAYFGVSVWVQIVVFLAVSGICFAFTKKFLKNVLKVEKQPTNSDSLIGKEGVVTEEINNIECKGKVFISGLTWSAHSVTGENIQKDTIVIVDRIEGVTLIVEKK